MDGHTTRITVIGLEDGRKRTLIWEDGALSGDDDLISRFKQSWDAADHQKYRHAADDDWGEELAKEILSGLFAETLDIERAWISTPKRLQEWADAWNSHKDQDHHYTAEEMREIEAKQNWPAPEHASQPPADFPKCLDCLQPMEWIWFSSSPWTWQHLCGRAGWTPICRACKSWRACRVEEMN
jgi:hypothetical protein